MHTVYDWLSVRGDCAACDGRRNWRQREWPVMPGDTIDCGHRLAHGGHQRDFSGFADRAQSLIVSTHPGLTRMADSVGIHRARRNRALPSGSGEQFEFSCVSPTPTGAG
jgi:hypothetical protein